MPITNPPQPPGRKSGGTPAKRTPSPGPSKTKKETRTENALGILEMATAVAIFTQNYADAGALQEHSANLASAIAGIAEDKEKVADILDKADVGPYAELVGAAIPFLIQLAVNHNRLDINKMSGIQGVMEPAVLASKVQAEMDRKKTEILRAAKEAREEAEAAAQELANMQAPQQELRRVG